MRKSKCAKPKFKVGQVVALCKLRDGVREYGVIEEYDTNYIAPYAVQISSSIGAIWRQAWELRPLTKREMGL